MNNQKEHDYFLLNLLNVKISFLLQGNSYPQILLFFSLSKQAPSKVLPCLAKVTVYDFLEWQKNTKIEKIANSCSRNPKKYLFLYLKCY